MKTPLAALTLLLLAAGCASTWHPHSFLPAPLEVPVGIEGEAQASVLLTVLGIRRASTGAGTPTQVEVLLQVENLSETVVYLERGSLSLVTSDLVAFSAPRVEPATSAPLARGEQALFEVSFPLPPGEQLDDLDLRGIHLKWTLDFEGRRVTTGVTFDRRLSGWPYRPMYY